MDENMELSDLTFDKEFHEASIELFTDVYSEGVEGTDKINKIVLFIKRTIRNLILWIEKTNDNSTMIKERNEQLKLRIVKAYSKIGERELDNIPFDYDNLDNVMDAIIQTTNDIFRNMNHAIQARSHKDAERSISEAKKTLEKFPVIKEDYEKKMRSKNLCGRASKYLVNYPGRHVTKLRDILKEVYNSYDKSVDKLYNPIDDDGKMTLTQVARDIRDVLGELIKHIRESIRMYKKANMFLVKVILSEYEQLQN